MVGEGPRLFLKFDYINAFSIWRIGKLPQTHRLCKEHFSDSLSAFFDNGQSFGGGSPDSMCQAE
jgi:hypothetical protein